MWTIKGIDLRQLQILNLKNSLRSFDNGLTVSLILKDMLPMMLIYRLDQAVIC